MRCNNCNNELPAGWNYPCCPQCGSPLQNAAGTAGHVSLGDANAFAGDVSISTNITNVERQKTESEIISERKAEYRKLCLAVLADGRVDPDEAKSLENLRVSLGLSPDEANAIFEEAKRSATRQSVSTLGKIQQMSLNQVVSLARQGKYEQLASSISRLETMAQKYADEQLHHFYNLILAGIDPKRAIASYEARAVDNYWQSYWTAMAMINEGRTADAEEIMGALEAWDDKPFGNVALLAAVNSLYEYWKDRDMTDFHDQALMFLEQGGEECSPELDRFAQVLMMLIELQDPSELDGFHDDFRFYIDKTFRVLIDRINDVNAHAAIPEIPKIDLLPE